MTTRRCCCGCELGDDDFNRADGDPGSGWYGDGVIASNLLESDNDYTTICHPGGSTGAFWSKSVMKHAADGSTYQIKVGDPADNLTVTIVFAGTIGIGTGTYTITVSDGTNSEEWEYDWENEDEFVIVCFLPEIYLSAATGSRTSDNAPHWVTLCISETASPCYTV